MRGKAMKGKKILPVLGLMGVVALACTAPNYNTTQNNSSQYKQEYNQKYDNTDSDGDGLSDAKEKELGTNPFDKDTDDDGVADGMEVYFNHTNPLPEEEINSQKIQTASLSQKSLSVEEMLAIKKKIEKADQYTARKLPGNALIQLLEAQESAGTNNFKNELEPRIKQTVAVLTDELSLYKINARISDKTQSGKAEQIKYALVEKNYVSGIELISSGGNYTLTLDMRSMAVDNKVSSFSHVILIPTGSTKNLNGQFVALQQTVMIECKDYFAERDAARGSGMQVFRGIMTAYNASQGEDVLGMIGGIANTAEGVGRIDNKNVSEAECKELEERLEATSMYTSDTQTTPFQYEEVITRKWATLDFRISLTSATGTVLYASPPLELEFVRENVKKPDIPAANIRGSAGEEISNKEVMQGLLTSIDDELYTQIDKGAIVWDIITAFQAKKRTGESTVEAYMQLAFHAHAPELKGAAVQYFSAHNPTINVQLAEIVEAR